MVYLAGIIGLIGGFSLGQMVLLRLLKDYSNEEIMQNKNLRWTYGVLNWLVAILGSTAMVWAYKQYWPLF